MKTDKSKAYEELEDTLEEELDFIEQELDDLKKVLKKAGVSPKGVADIAYHKGQMNGLNAALFCIGELQKT